MSPEEKTLAAQLAYDKALQQRFTGRTYDMWRPEEYQAFSDARGQQCALATATVTRWVVEMM